MGFTLDVSVPALTVFLQGICWDKVLLQALVWKRFVGRYLVCMVLVLPVEKVYSLQQCM